MVSAGDTNSMILRVELLHLLNLRACSHEARTVNYPGVMIHTTHCSSEVIQISALISVLSTSKEWRTKGKEISSMLWSLTRKRIYTRAEKNVKLLPKKSVMSSTKASLKRNKLKHISRDTRINVCQ